MIKRIQMRKVRKIIIIGVIIIIACIVSANIFLKNIFNNIEKIKQYYRQFLCGTVG